MKQLYTYPERDKFISENELIGNMGCDLDTATKYNIWTCELYKNKQTNKYLILITSDDDEEWDTIEFM